MAVYFHAFFMRGEISASWHSENAPFELMEYTLEQQCYVARMKAQNSFVALMDELDKQMDLQEDDPSGNADQMDETTEAKLFDGELIQAFEEFTKRFDLK